MDEARRVEARARRDQSDLRHEQSQCCHSRGRDAHCPRRESNPHLRFRKPSFYPLNYGDNEIFEFRFANADCPAKRRLIIRELASNV